jgi:hypothetical protein
MTQRLFPLLKPIQFHQICYLLPVIYDHDQIDMDFYCETFVVGLIEANVALGKLKDAARVTREMAELYPKSAEACYLLGTVLSRAKGNDGVNAVSKASPDLTFHIFDSTPLEYQCLQQGS